MLASLLELSSADLYGLNFLSASDVLDSPMTVVVALFRFLLSSVILISI